MLWHQSGVNQKGEPFVQLILEDKLIAQMSPQEARDHGLAMFEAAEAAEQDAFLLEFHQKTLGVTLAQAMQLVVEFRKWREAHGKKGPPSDASEWVKP